MVYVVLEGLIDTYWKLFYQDKGRDNRKNFISPWLNWNRIINYFKG